MKFAELRREEACAVCAVKGWLDNRHDVFLFKGGVTTTTWRDHCYGSAENPREEENEEDDGARVVSNRPLAVLLVDEDGKF